MTANPAATVSHPLLDRLSVDERAIVDAHTREAPVRLAALARALGLSVYRSRLNDQISGKIQAVNFEDASAGFEIRVNKFENPRRQRFTVAHEISHYLLHRDRIKTEISDSIMYRSTLSSKLEAEANSLAAELIMPSTLIKRDIAKYGRPTSEADLAWFAERYNVSKEAMRIRLGM